MTSISITVNRDNPSKAIKSDIVYNTDQMAESTRTISNPSTYHPPLFMVLKHQPFYVSVAGKKSKNKL